MQGFGNTQDQIALNQGTHEDRLKKGGHIPLPNQFSPNHHFLESHRSGLML